MLAITAVTHAPPLENDPHPAQGRMQLSNEL